MPEKAAVFETNYQFYLEKLSEIDLPLLADPLGGRAEEDGLVIPFFGEPHRVSSRGIIGPSGNRPAYAVCIVLFKYVLMCPSTAPFLRSEWMSYKDFKDAAPLIGYFARDTEQAIADTFSGRLPSLEAAAKTLGGTASPLSASRDFAMEFQALPKVPLLLLFDDADEEFPARSTVLFQKSTARYLDMESVGVLGALFARRLKDADHEEMIHQGDIS